MGWVSTLIQGIATGVNIFSSVKSNEASYKGKVSTNLESYKSSLDSANEYLKKADVEYTKVKSDITSKYGSNVFELLQKQYNEKNGIGDVAVSRGNLGRYDTENGLDGNPLSSYVDTRMIKWGGNKSNSNLSEVGIGFDSNYDKHSFDTSKTTSIVDQIYNSLATGDSALAQELRLSGNQIQTMLGNAQDEVNQTIATQKSNMSQTALQWHSQNLSSTLEVANARATMASSGIRNTGTGNASENLQRLQADLTSAYYAMNIKAQAMQLQNEIYNTQKSASISAYQSKAEIEYTKRQNYENVVGLYSEGVSGAEEYTNTARNYAEMANEYAKYDNELQDASWWKIATEG